MFVFCFSICLHFETIDVFQVIVTVFRALSVTVHLSKYLGVLLDERLSWNEHVKAIVSKAGRWVGMLGHVRRYITFQSANAIYMSMIRLILEYCAGV